MLKKIGEIFEVHNPSKLPPQGTIETIEEPIITAMITARAVLGYFLVNSSVQPSTFSGWSCQMSCVVTAVMPMVGLSKARVTVGTVTLTVTLAGENPVALDAEPLTEAFTLAGLEGEDRHVQLYVSQDDWQRSREMIEALREVTGSLDLQILPDGALSLLAASAVKGANLSLMQGEFTRRTGWRKAIH